MNTVVVNQEVLKVFANRLSAKRLAHAFLLIAPDHAGKTATAKAIAALVNCQEAKDAPCGFCSSCLKINNGNHPDIQILANDDQTIKIDQIRQLLSRAQLRAYEAKYKVFIIPDAHRMTTEAANAFLKTLEEPSANSLILLTTHLPQLVLDTVKSRCQWIRFQPQGVGALTASLIEEGVDVAQARFLSRYAGGWALVAKHLLNDGFYRQQQTIIETVFVQQLPDDMIKELVDDDQLARRVLDVIVSCVRDAFIYQATQRRQLLSHDQSFAVIERLSTLSPAALTAIVQQAKQIKNQIDENLNAKMAWQILKERLWNPLSK